MKILIPTADYPPIEGGISTVAAQIARELAALGHEVTVIAPYFPGQAEADAAAPVRVIRYHGYGLGWLRIIPMFAAAWPQVARTDLILAINLTYGGIIGRLARKRHGVPYVTFAYAYEFLKFARIAPAAACLRGIYASARVTAAISTFTRDQLVAFGADPAGIEVIFPGAPARRDLPPGADAAVRRKYALDDGPDAGPLILSAGRFVPRKGQLTLVRAMPRILERVPNAQFLLAGRGPCLTAAVRAAHDLGVRDHVVFPGCVPDDDLAALYQTCDVFALPTGRGANGQVEGYGLVFNEAHAYGKPVVAGRSGGVVDAVRDGETGLIIEPDDPEALAQAILRLIEDPAYARQLGEQGRKRVETELNWRCFTQRLLEAIEARA